MTFAEYSYYYDLFYREKNYREEAAYVHTAIRRYAPSAQRLLNLGCGTGNHDVHFTDFGYHVTGIDLSSDMVEIAKKKAKGTREYVQGDIRSFSQDEPFDVIVSLFHVMSYITENNDLAVAMKNIARHLKPGGYFLFDCWNGSGVLTDPPVTRVRRFNDRGERIIRIAESEVHVNRNTVDVKYQIIVINTETNSAREINETHTMRYFFIPELHMLAESAGLEPVAFEEWMTGREPSPGTWNAMHVFRKPL